MLTSFRSCLAITTLIALSPTVAWAVTPFHTDDFQSGTSAGWTGGATLVVEPNGQGGPGDFFLNITSTGDNGPGSRLATYTASSEWVGDYDSEDIQSISIDMMNPIVNTTSLDMRLVLFGPNSTNDRWTSGVATVVPNDGVWRRYDFEVDENAMILVRGASTHDMLMGNVIRAMFRHDVIGSQVGTPIAATLGIDNVTINGILAGDFDGDLDLDTTDIDALVGEIVAGSGAVAFDLTGDNVVDHDDLAEWLVLGGARNLPGGDPYQVGDADLNGLVDEQDYETWAANRFTNTPQWSLGDFNADGAIELPDLHLWNEHKFSTGTTAVPEPSWPLGLWIVMTGVATRQCRRLRFDVSQLRSTPPRA